MSNKVEILVTARDMGVDKTFNEATRNADQFGRAVDKTTEKLARAGLAARSAGASARSAARQAADAQDRAARAADKAKMAELEAAEATDLAAEAAEKLERGEIKAAEAQKLTADAAKKYAHAQEEAAVAARLAASAAEKLERANLRAGAAQLASGKAARQFAEEGSKAGDGFMSGLMKSMKGLGSVGGVPAPVAAFLAGAVVAAAPFAAAAFGGAFVSALGVVGIGAALAAQFHDPAVHQGLTRLRDDAKTQLRDVTSGLTGELATGLAIVDDNLRQHRGTMQKFFTALKPEVTQVFAGASALMGRVLDGLPDLAGKFQPVINTFSRGLAALGDAFHEFEEDVGTDSRGLADGVMVAFAIIAGGIRGVGAVIKYSEILVRRFFDNLQDALDAAAALDPTGHMDKLADRLRANRDMSDGLSVSLGKVAESAGMGETAMGRLADQLERANTDLNNLIDSTLEYSNATLTANHDLTAFAKQVRENGGSFDVNTDAGYANATMLNRLIGEAKRAKDAEIEHARVTGGDVPAATRKATRTFDAYLAQLYAATKQAGGNTRAVERMIRAVLGIPKSVRFKVTPQGIDNAMASIAAVKSTLRALDGMRATVHVHTQSDGPGFFDRFGHFAHGGIVGGAASGGPRSNLTMVGEHGRELVHLPAGSRVMSNPDTERALASGRESAPVRLEIAAAGDGVSQMLLQILRKAIRIQGGNVQLVLGGR